MSLQEAKQRFVGLKVREVSLVDSPANEEDFTVVKSLSFTTTKAVWTAADINDLPDSAFLVIDPGGEKDSDGKTAPRTLRHFPVKDTAGKVDLPHLRNALARIPQSNLSADAKAKATAEAEKMLAAAQKSPDQEVKKFMDKPEKKPVETVADDTKTVLKSLDAFAAELKKVEKGKMPPELMAKMKETMGDAKKAMGDNDGDEEDKLEAERKAKKSQSDVAITVKANGDVEVTKGGKQFSGARTEALKTATSHMMQTLKEVDPEGFNAMVRTMSLGGEADPAPSAATMTNPPLGSSISMGDFKSTVKGLLDPVIEKLTATEKRLDTIEGTRPVSKAIGADPAKPKDDEKPVAKGAKPGAGFWKGML